MEFYNNNISNQWVQFVEQLQDAICTAVEQQDGKAVFHEDTWNRQGGGYGKTRIIAHGNVFEKGSVNTSVVYGEVTEAMRTQLNIQGDKWFASGLSVVLHPFNPFVPTIHCNYRMFELYSNDGQLTDRWFGGGTDLTPYYLFDEDAVHFHCTYRDICNRYDLSFYPAFKHQCDIYFTNTHRNNECRGVGGIFYDYKRATQQHSVEMWMQLAHDCGYGFIPSYIPIVTKRKETQFNSANKFWQEIRRGRYTEFNLVHDRGTLFGLKTNGRTESILMSLPPTVRFEYDYHPEAGSEEERIQQVCLHPIDWVSMPIISNE